MFVVLFLIIFTIFIVIFGWYVQQKWQFRTLRHIPGAPKYPLLGSALEFGLNPIQNLKDMIRLVDTYGPISTFTIGPEKYYLLVADPELTEFFLSSPRFISKSSDYDLLRPWINDGLLTSNGLKWHKRRKMITPAFHFNILEEFIPIFNSGANVLIKRLFKEINEPFFDIYPYITAYTLDSICETAMGTSVMAQENDNHIYVKSVKNLGIAIINRLFSTWKQIDCLYKYAPEYKEYVNSLNTIHNFIKLVVKKRKDELLNKSNMNETNDNDDLGIRKTKVFLDLLLTATYDGKPLNDDDIAEEVNTFMFEGHDTTASAISFTLYEIGKNPHIQKKIYDEINEIFSGNLDREPTLYDLNNMKYLEAVIKESLRLYPSVPFIARNLEEDAIYKGTKYPKGLTIMFFFYYMQRRSDLFENSKIFNPDRYLIENKIQSKSFSNTPFSAGPRNCIGQKFAMYEMKAVISKIIRNYELLTVDPKNDDIILSMEVTLKSATPIPICLKKRN